MKTLIDHTKNIAPLYEGILSDIDTQLSRDEITEMLWDGLCNTTRDKWHETGNWIFDYMQRNGTLDTSDLGVYRKKIYLKNDKKAFIKFLPRYDKSKLLHIEILTAGVKFYLSPNFPLAKRFDVNSYYTDESNKSFSDADLLYELPNEFKPFVNRCIEFINKNGGLRKKIATI